jgi:hypothetical protein
VTLTVTDPHGAPGSAVTTATIGNVAPSLDAGADHSTTVDSAVEVNATFSDPGLADGPWAFTIAWGDGTATAGSVTSPSSPIRAAHVYPDAGTDSVRVTVTDKDGGTASATFTVTVAPLETTVTLVGAGSIARCASTGELRPGADSTAAILDRVAGSVFTLGNAVMPGGTAASYANCYDPTWGRHKSRTYPVPGRHDYDSSATAEGYFNYFGAAAAPGMGYYSFDLGAWHIIMLNSSNAYVSTAAGSPQETWLKADLAATTKRCVLAMWYEPRFYSTKDTISYANNDVKPFWNDLYAAGAELVLNGHMRDYERFAPQTPSGVADPNGIREFIVGTGGDGHDSRNTFIHPNSEVNISEVFGVLKLTLGDGTYSWEFIPVAGQTATDSGSASCH